MNLWPIPIELFFWKDFMPSILQSLDFSILDWNCNNTNRCRPKNLRPVVLASAILAIKSSFWLFFAIFVPSFFRIMNYGKAIIYQDNNKKHCCQIVFPLFLIWQHCSSCTGSSDFKKDQHVQDGKGGKRNNVHEHQIHPGKNKLGLVQIN